MRDRTEPLKFIHFKKRIFVPGLNKYFEQNVDVNLVSNLQIYRQVDGDLYWEHLDACGYIPKTDYDCVVCQNKENKKEKTK